METFNNLIDFYIECVEDPDLAGNMPDIFKKMLSKYFFKKETYDSKSLDAFFEKFGPPSFFNELDSLFNLDMNTFTEYIHGSTTNDSLSGKIMLSTAYLKSFYQDHPPSFTKLPEDVQEEVFQKIKKTNEAIIGAFEKMLSDRKADKNRKMLTLIALILKNIHRKTSCPFNPLKGKAEDIIKSIVSSCDETFTASQKQLVSLSNDNDIKSLIKEFFKIKKFQDIVDMAELFQTELERYKKRALMS